ncbi:MAG: hypothetical protein ACXWQA_00310 [Pseudobdellovibrionaceae bacterium]
MKIKTEMAPLSRKIVWFCVAFFIVSMSCFAIQSEDLFMYLAIAREYFKTGAFPVYDPFLYSIPHFAWTIFHQWLGYLAFYGLYEWGGYSLIIITKTILITGALCLPWWRARKSSEATLIWGVSVLIAVLAMSFRLMERTSLFSDFFIVIILTILMAEQARPSRWKYLLPLLFIFWVNLHPGFPIGWFLCGIFLLANFKKWRTSEYQIFLGLSLMSVWVCLLNPQRLEGFLYPFHFMQGEGAVYRKFYFEWMPTFHPLFREHAQTYFILGLILLNIILIFHSRKLKPIFEMTASGFFIIYGLYAIRFVPSFCFALVALNTSLAMRIGSAQLFKQRSICFAGNLAIAALALTLAGKNMIWGYETLSGHRDFGLGLDEHVVPYQAAKILDESGLTANVYNSHLFGSYLAWAWEGRRKILYHGFVTDTDFFLNEFRSFSTDKDHFESQVNKFNIGAFLLDRFQGNESLLSILAQNPHWQLVYKDEGSLIFIKK